MYDESVVVSCVRDGRETRQTLTCFVSSATTGDPVSGEMLDSERVDMNFSFARTAWPFLKTVRRGDLVLRGDVLKCREFVVQDVTEDDVMGIVISARGN